MLEYTSAFVKIFPWAKAAYNYEKGLPTPTVNVNGLTDPVGIDLEPYTLFIDTEIDWNKYSFQHTGTIYGMYQTVESLENYYNSLYNGTMGRLAEASKRVAELESSLKVSRTVLESETTASLTIRGGETDWIETNPRYYINYGRMAVDVEEKVFKLPDTNGIFSSIRSQGGFSGQVFIERSLGYLTQNGTLRSIVDGSRRTFWTAKTQAPAPMMASESDIPWLPDNYRYGSAVLLTYVMDRPTLASELFIDPMSTETLDVVSISWMPHMLKNIISDSGFNTPGNWTTVGSSTVSASGGIDNSASFYVTATTGYTSYTFGVVAGLNSSVSGLLTTAASSYITSNRFDVRYAMKGTGLIAGVRMIWYRSDGTILNYEEQTNFTTSYYSNYVFTGFIPTNAASGLLQVGNFKNQSSGTANFDNLTLRIGEYVYNCTEEITKPTTIYLPEPVTSQRFSVVLCQRNCRREINATQSADVETFGFNDVEVNDQLQKATQKISDSFNNRGTGSFGYTYRIGLKELDFRYREHVPRASLVSLPIKSRREIRKMWVTMELGSEYQAGLLPYIHPYENDSSLSISVDPFKINESTDGLSTLYASDGTILTIYTQEEYDAGWATSGRYLVVPRKKKTKTYNGTDYQGKLTLDFAPHLSKPLMTDAMDWLKSYSIWPTGFDPNAETLYGISDTTNLSNIRQNPTKIVPGQWFLDKLGPYSTAATGASLIDLSKIKTTTGYVPIKVTVKTNKWVAYPNTLGRTDIEQVYYVPGEILTPKDSSKTVTTTTSPVMDYESWLNTTTVQQVNALLPDSVVTFNNKYGFAKKFVEPIKQLMKRTNQDWEGSAYRVIFKGFYDRLVAQGQVPSTGSSSTTVTSTLDVNGVYNTKYFPIVNGVAGPMIKLFWANPVTGTLLPISSNDYTLNPTLGEITLLTTAPSSGFTQVVADYRYNANPFNDAISNTLSFITSDTSGNAGRRKIPARSVPFTQNMTDYVTGRIPVLRKFQNHDPLSNDYYPVIEYYVTPDGEIQFADSYNRYTSDEPATIIVEADSLDIAPRVGVINQRTGAPSRSPKIASISLGTRSSIAAPNREVLP